MLTKGLFKKPKNELEAFVKNPKANSLNVPDELCISCKSCKVLIFKDELAENFGVCPSCGYHFKMRCRQRIDLIVDKDCFEELFLDLKSTNILDFPGYEKKLKGAVIATSENEGVVCGKAKIEGHECCIFVMDADFMMGSMGTVVGEKITSIFEYGTENNLPVIGFTVSGGARMQEGILSLMQMAKTSGAVKRHSDSGNLYVTVLTDPTTGGVTASFAMEGDIIISEPNALIGFAGPRVIEQTIRQKLPKGFQRAEFLLEKGFVDEVVERKELKRYLGKILLIHKK